MTSCFGLPRGDGVAVKGYDVVSYFDQKKPIKGDPKYSYQYNGAKYDFTSSRHVALLAKNPEAYLPQYGLLLIMLVCPYLIPNEIAILNSGSA